MNPYYLNPDISMGPVHLTVTSIERSLTLYRDVLGLRPRFLDDSVVALAVGDDEPVVLLSEDVAAPRRSSRAPGLYHMAILVPGRSDLARILLRFSEMRYPIQGASDHGVSEALYLADPEGNGIEIYRDRPRSEWPVANDALQMVTEALDIEDVLSSLDDGAQQGSGLARGTRIGHVHLQVSHIAEAESFYHNVLGLDLMQRYGPSAAFLSAGGYHHHVGINTWMSAGSPPPPDGSTGLRYFTIIFPSDDALKQLVAHIVSLDIPFEKLSSGLLVRDPSQNGILLAASQEGR